MALLSRLFRCSFLASPEVLDAPRWRGPLPGFACHRLCPTRVRLGYETNDQTSDQTSEEASATTLKGDRAMITSPTSPTTSSRGRERRRGLASPSRCAFAYVPPAIA